MNRSQRWNEPDLIVGLSSGAGDSFSLEGRHDTQFVLVAQADGVESRTTAEGHVEQGRLALAEPA